MVKSLYFLITGFYFYFRNMKYLLAIFLPWLALMLCGKILQGILCLILQITLIGWIPAVIWAIVVLNKQDADRRTDKIVRAIRESKKHA